MKLDLVVAVALASALSGGAMAQPAAPVDGVKVFIPGHTDVTFTEYSDTLGSPESFVGTTFLPAGFSAATVFLTEPANQGGGYSDALTIMTNTTGGVNILFFSDPVEIPTLDIMPRQFTIAETGKWQDVSSYFGQPAGFAQVISDVDVVPEPGAWSMLIVGLGALGAALRRRRSTVPA